MNTKALILLSALALPATTYARSHRKVTVYQQRGEYYRDVLEHDKELEKENKKLRDENKRLKRQAKQGNGKKRRRRRRH